LGWVTAIKRACFFIRVSFLLTVQSVGAVVTVLSICSDMDLYLRWNVAPELPRSQGDPCNCGGQWQNAMARVGVL
jgi:hypothetical protein